MTSGGFAELNSVLEHYLNDSIGDGLVQVMGTLVFIGLVWLLSDSFNFSRRVSILFANVSTQNYTFLAPKFPSVTLPTEIFSYMTSKQLNALQKNNQIVPIPVGSAILPFNIFRSSVHFTKNPASTEHLQLTDISFELDTLIPIAVEIYCGVHAAVLEKNVVVRHLRNQASPLPAPTTPLGQSIQQTSSPSIGSRTAETNNLVSRGPTSLVRDQLPPPEGISDDNIAMQQIQHISGMGSFEKDSAVSQEQALFAMERIKLAAGLKQGVKIGAVPVINPRQLHSMARADRNSVKSEALLLRSSSREHLGSLDDIANQQLLVKHWANQAKLLSSAMRNLIPFVIVVRALKPLDLTSPATVNIRVADYAGEVDLSKSTAWFLLFGKTPRSAPAQDQASSSNNSTVAPSNRVSPQPESDHPVAETTAVGAGTTGAFRLEHMTHLAYIPNPQLPPPETYKWLECEELFGTTSSSKENLSAANQAGSDDPKALSPSSTSTSPKEQPGPSENPRHSTTSLSESAADDENLQCCVCLSDPASIMILPCRHVCMCFDCFRGPDEEYDEDGRPVQTTNVSQSERIKRDWAAAANCEYIPVNLSCHQCPVCRAKVRAWVEITK